MNTLLQDLRFALRMFLKSPGFTLVAMLTLALGVGANTALFSVVNRVLFSPLPFKDPDRLVMVWSTDRENNFDRQPLSDVDFNYWREANHTFEDLAVMDLINGRLNWTGGAEPVAIKGAYVTPSFFGVFGMRPVLGRLSASDTAAADGRCVVLSYRFWQRQFSGNTNIVGQALTLNGRACTVLGVLQPTLGFLDELVEAYVPQPKSWPNSQNWGTHYLACFGRLKADVTLAQARADLAGLCDIYAREHSERKGWGAKVMPQFEDVVGPVRPALLVLHGAVVCLLLIACTNVANLLLARAETRSKEMAIRAAVGASRLRIFRQLLTESLLLSLGGGGVGLLWAYWSIGLLQGFTPRVMGISVPFFAEVRLDGRVLAFGLVVTVVAGLLFGLAPAWHASKPNLNEGLKEGGRGATAGRRRHRLLNTLVVCQVTLAMVLLAGAGLMLKSFYRLAHLDPGFDPRNVLTMELELPYSRYPEPAARVEFYRQVAEQIAALPGVESVGVINCLPMETFNNQNAFLIEGAPPLPPNRCNNAGYRIVNYDYHRALRIPLRRGRLLNPQDDGPAHPAALINETLAKRFFPKKDPLGHRLSLVGSGGPFEIVGIVGDERGGGLGEKIQPMIYQPFTQRCNPRMWVLVRTLGEPMGLAGTIRRQIWTVDKDQPVDRVAPLSQVVRDSISLPRFSASLLAGFAGVGLLLAALGIYGVLTYVAAQRTHELGVRLALGAERRDLLRLIVSQGLKLTGLGLGLGLAIALGLGRLLQSLLYDMSPADPLTLAMVLLVLGLVAFLACYLPARRAARVDPMTALRCE
jgi:putative ABC transport system permease protein